MKCEVNFIIYLFCRKAAPLCAKLQGPGQYHQYSRVDVRTSTNNTMDTHLDNESDNEDDPTKLLDQWLGELNTLKKVRKIPEIKLML